MRSSPPPSRLSGYQKLVDGGATEGVEVKDADHRGTFVYAVAAQKKWFDDFVAKAASK